MKAGEAMLRISSSLQKECVMLGAGATDDGRTSPEAPDWDTELHVPPWISANEANQISMRLDGWAQELLAVSAMAG